MFVQKMLCSGCGCFIPRFIFSKKKEKNNNLILYSLLFSGASISDRSQTDSNLSEERISVRRSLTDSLAVSSMLLLQPQQVSFNCNHNPNTFSFFLFFY